MNAPFPHHAPFVDSLPVPGIESLMGINQQSVVYFVKIGRFIKIGYSANLKKRMKAYLTSSPYIELLLAIPGDRDLERGLQKKLADCLVERELFRPEYRILSFINITTNDGLTAGLAFLEATDPANLARQKKEDQERRVAEARKTKAEKDAYFAAIVADRKKRLGW